MAHKKTWLGMLALMLTFGLILAGCDNNTDNGNPTEELVYTYKDANDNTYRLVVTKNPARNFEPQSGDQYRLTITSPNGNIETSTGTVTDVNPSGDGIIFSLENTHGRFTVGVSGTIISQIPDPIILDDGRRQEPPDTLKPGPSTPTITSVTVSAAGNATSVEKGARLQFSAVVNGTNSPAQTVTWSIVETDKHTNTTITAGGLLTVALEETLQALTIRASSTADPTKSGDRHVSVTAPLPPVADRITIMDISDSASGTALPGTPPRQNLEMNRASVRRFIADVYITGGQPKSTANQQILWNVPANYVHNVTGAPSASPTSPRYSVTFEPVNGINRWVLTLSVSYDQLTTDTMNIEAFYNGDLPSRNQSGVIENPPYEDPPVNINGEVVTPVPTSRLKGSFDVNISRDPPGLILDNNRRRIAEFTTANTTTVQALSRFFYFDKPSGGIRDYTIRLFTVPGSTAGLNNPLPTFAMNVRIRFYDTNGNMMTISGGASEVNVTSELTSDPYTIIIIHNNTGNAIIAGDGSVIATIPADYAYVLIEIMNVSTGGLAPSASNPLTTGQVGIDWAGSRPSAD